MWNCHTTHPPLKHTHNVQLALMLVSRGLCGSGRSFLHFTEARSYSLKANSPAACPAWVTFPASSHLSVTPLVSQARNQSSSNPLWPSTPTCALWPNPVISTQSLSTQPFSSTGELCQQVEGNAVVSMSCPLCHQPTHPLHCLPTHFSSVLEDTGCCHKICSGGK